MRSFDAAVADRVLCFLKDGSAPFLKLAARRARYPEALVAWWFRAGRQEHADLNDPQTQWALEVAGVQADWCAKQLAWLETVEKEGNERARQVSWMLQRLDRELFDLSRPPKEAPPGESNLPKHKKSAAEIADELGKPDLQ